MLLKEKYPSGIFINLIKSQLLLIAMFAVAIGILDQLPAFQKNITSPCYSGIGRYSCLSPAGFQISQSYERWWEAPYDMGSHCQ